MIDIIGEAYMTKNYLKIKLLLSCSLGMLGATMASQVAFAQNGQGAAVSSEAPEEIVVTGIRGSLAKGIEEKRNATSFIDSLASEDIADFPDLNISEALQRVPGVTINRIEGEGQQVTVRGLAPEFTQILLNGNTVTSGGGREVDLDIFASELFNNVKLIKTPYAALTEGGLAATIDLRTARPFDFKDFIVAGTLQGVYNDVRKKMAPRGSVLISKTWNDTFGILVSAGYSESKLRGDSVEGQRYLLRDFTGITGGQFGVLEFAGLPRSVIEPRDRERLGLTAAIQFRPSDNIELNADIAYAKLSEFRTRHSIDGLTLGGTTRPISITRSATDPRFVVAGTFDGVSTRTENVFDDISDKLLIANFDGTFGLGNGLKAYGKFSFSKAKNKQDLFRVLYDFTGRFSYALVDFNGAQVPTFRSENFSFTDLNAYRFNQSRFIDTFIDDTEYAFQGDLIKEFDGSFIKQLSGGMRYASRKNETISFDGTLGPAQLNGAAPSLSQVGVINPFAFFEGQGPASLVRDFAIIPFDRFSGNTVIFPPNYVPPQQFGGTFDIKENTLGGYVQADFDGSAEGLGIRGNVGVRVVKTKETSTGFALLPTGPAAVVDSNSYLDILPSINVAFDVSDDIVLRTAASRAITRPTLSALNPGISGIERAALTANKGNPDLDPFRVSQIDVGLEWYFAKDSLLAATFFHKEIESFITRAPVAQRLGIPGPLFNDANVDVSQSIFNVTQPINGKGASVTGVEISYQQPLSFLPAPWDGFGVAANYTYASSKFDYTFDNRVFTGPFPGQSKHSYNLVGYYENKWLSARFAYAWRDDYLSFLGNNTRRNDITGARGQLDFSSSVKVIDGVSLTFDVLNLLGEENSIFGDTQDRGLVFEETGRFYSAGLRFKF
jgi:iron complex outermembrane recepter protein